MPATQKDRPLAATSPLGADILLLRKMSAAEELGRLFEYDLDLLSTDYAIDPDKILGQAITVRLETESGKRYFNGNVASFAEVGTWGNYARYRAVLRPWLWFLSRTADCRIFQNQTVPDMIKSTFRELGFSDFKESLSGSYRQWEYCVQYRESDFAFVSRLMEQEGIYYYFTHEEGKHTLVLADSVSAHGPFPGYDKIGWFPPNERARQIHDGLWEWATSSEVQTGAYVHTDYDFENPAANLQAKRQVNDSYAQAKQEWFDYPGEYVQSRDGDQYAQVRIQERHAGRQTAQGQGNARGLAVGYFFTLTDHPRADQNQEYLVTSARYELQSDEFETHKTGELASDLFGCQFTAISSQIPFRSAATTPKPSVRGPQSAVVVGPSGKEIWTDKYGRIKVQFHWDRLGKKDEQSSCWMRVSQQWGGQNWGFLFIPRIGQEVLVDFLDGDPDRPIVTGRVYNANQMPPYALPGAETQSVIKSRSTPKGTTQNFHELRFEDKKDAEEVYFHSERDFNRVVENNDTLKVGFEKKDKGDQTIEIWNNRTETVQQGNESVTVKTGNRTVTLDKGNDTHQLKKGNRDVKIDQGNDVLTITQGDQTVKLSAGTCTIQAGKAIELKVGGNSVTINAQGVTIKGTQVAVEGQGKVDVKGPMANVTGSGALNLKGGIVKIN